MKKALTFSTVMMAVGLLTTAIPTNASAEGGYYLEIGKRGTVEETHEKWRDLSEKYKSLLGKLTFYPKSVIDQNGESVSVIQAGPVSERNRAEKICKTLFSKQISCFVIEGIEKRPPSVVIGMSRAISSRAGSLPWQDVGEAPPVLAENIPPVQTAAQEKPARETIDNRVASVEVAQAIPVPLTSETDSDFAEITDLKPYKSKEEVEVKTTFVPENKPAIAAKPREIPLVKFASIEAGWLNISAFPSEADANKFWSKVTSRNPDLIDGLRARIQRPLLANSRGRVEINVGTFGSGAEAADFCNQAVMANDPTLRCSFEETPDMAEDVRAPGTSQHSNAYENRRKLFERRLPAEQIALRERRVFATNTEERVSNKFWAQVVIADGKNEAKRRFEEIKKKHADIIDDLPDSLLSSSSAHAKYTVRLGPITNEKANEICDKLQQRGADCLVISTR
jgi:hypothetical protein